MRSGVLDGLLVLDLGEVMQVPFAAQILGDYGADVIKVERMDIGDSLRRTDVQANAKGEMGAHFSATNRNKRSIALDIKAEADRAILYDLIARADVLLHNYRPGVAERVGIGYDTLRDFNPRLIYAHATGFGETGPLAKQGGQDMILQSWTGIAQETAGPGNTPVLVNMPAVDYASAQALAQGILLALIERDKTGKGQKVTTSLYNTAIALQALEGAAALRYGAATHWFDASANFVFKTRDGYLTVLGFFRDNPLKAICEALRLPDESSRQPHLATIDGQREHRDEIQEMLSGPFGALDTDDAQQLIAGADILCAPVRTLAQALDHDQTAKNGLILDITLPDGAPARVIGFPLTLADSPARVRHMPPAIDADREEILDWLYGPANRRSGGSN